jgi:hypothetical protein
VLHQWFNTSCIQESNLAGVIRKALDQVRDLCEDNADAESDSDMVCSDSVFCIDWSHNVMIS